MQKFSVLIAASISLFVTGLSAKALVTSGVGIASSSNTSAGSVANFVIAPFQVGNQTLFSSSILNINKSALGAPTQTATLSGNNAGPAPQGGIGIRQGGLFGNSGHAAPGYAAAGITGGTSGSNFGNGLVASGNSLVSSLSATSSSGFINGTGNTTNTATNNGLNTGNSLNNQLNSGFNSQNLNGGLSSTGSFGGNVNSGSSSVGFGSANNNGGLSSVGQSSSNFNGGLSSVGQSSANNGSGMSSVGQNSANNGFGLGQTSVGQNSANNGTSLNNLSNNLNNNATGTTPVLVLTNLSQTTSPQFGSTGAAFQGAENTSTISNVSFQFGSIDSLSGQLVSSIGFAPLLAIDDETNTSSGQKTRYLPITSGTITTPTNGIGLSTVTFNADQLRIQGRVSHIGITFLQEGTVLVNNITVNGNPSQGLLAQGNQSYPF